tara:strand:- start:530 stop:904 length:375 start_codon:yes stop_codon:yes gene_type:complete
MIDKLVKQELNQKVWSFTELANVNDTINSLADTIYNKMPTTEKIEMIWNTQVFSETRVPFGQLYMTTVMEQLKVRIAEIVKQELATAKVQFNEVNKNENAERSLGGEPYTESPPNEKEDSEVEE